MTLWLPNALFEDEWLTEGMAEYASLVALRELQLLGEDELRGMAVGFTNAYLARIPGRPLQGRSAYLATDGGVASMHLATTRLRSRSGGRLGFGDLVKALLERSARADFRYSRYDLFHAYRELSGDPEGTAMLSRIADQGLGPGGGSLLTAALREVGEPVEEASLIEVLGALDRRTEILRALA